ncbi:MAG: NAD(P)-dependent oxidoreductase [Candidatus Sulfotelmatobacter sp.]
MNCWPSVPFSRFTRRRQPRRSVPQCQDDRVTAKGRDRRKCWARQPGDDEALIAALRSGRVAAAGLDVYEGEPHIHPAYRTLPNTVLLPHLGSATIETRTQMGMIALDNLDAHFAGRSLLTPVLG